MPPGETVASPDTVNRERAFRVFCCLWAVAAGFEYASAIGNRGPAALILLILLTRFAAVWLISRPADARRLVVLSAVLATTIAVKLPKSPNHGMFVLVASLTCLAAAAWVRVRDGRLATAAHFDAFAPALRWELVALYFWAVVQKLNTDFFALEVSCGPAQVLSLHRLMPFFPVHLDIQYFGIYGTIAVEAAIPLLLVFRRTRLVGIGLAMGFHYALGASYMGFSAMLFAMLALFAPASFYEELWRRGRSIFPRFAPPSTDRLLSPLDRAITLAVCGLGLAAFGVLATAPVTPLGGLGPSMVSQDSVRAIWGVAGALAIVIFAIIALRVRPFFGGDRGIWRLRNLALATFPLLVFANGFAPHLGLKNTQVFAMFSNLQTGGGVTNHFFLPSSWQVFDTLEDLVTIHESSDRVLSKLVGRSWKSFNYYSTYVVDRVRMERTQPAPTWEIPFVALRRRITDLHAAGETDVQLVYERDGVIRRLDHAERDAELASLPWLARKLGLQRAVPDSRRGYCLW